jgi:hypothetical protein
MNESIQLQSSLCLTCITCLLAGDWPYFNNQARTRLQCNKRRREWFVPRFSEEFGGKERYTVMNIESKQSLIPACGSVDLEQTKLGSVRGCRAA